MMRLAAVLFLSMAALPGQAEEFTTLKGHGGPIMDLAISPEGQVTSASFDNALGLWSGRHAQWLEGHEAAVTALDWGAGATLVSGGDDFAVRQWRPVARELGRHRGKVTSLSVAPDGSAVASGSWDGSIRLWPLQEDGRTGELSYPGAGVNAVAIGATWLWHQPSGDRGWLDRLWRCGRGNPRDRRRQRRPDRRFHA